MFPVAFKKSAADFATFMLFHPQGTPVSWWENINFA